MSAITIHPKLHDALGRDDSLVLVEGVPRIGKTTSAAVWLIEYAAAQQPPEPPAVATFDYLWIAASMSHARYVMDVLRTLVPASTSQGSRVTLPNQSTIWVEVGNAKLGHLGRAVGGAVIDDAEDCDGDAYWVALGALRGTGGPLRILGRHVPPTVGQDWAVWESESGWNLAPDSPPQCHIEGQRFYIPSFLTAGEDFVGLRVEARNVWVIGDGILSVKERNERTFYPGGRDLQVRFDYNESNEDYVEVNSEARRGLEVSIAPVTGLWFDRLARKVEQNSVRGSLERIRGKDAVAMGMLDEEWLDKAEDALGKEQFKVLYDIS